MITGATSGIGKACAEKFAACGYDLILTGRRSQHLEKIKDKITHNYKNNIHIIPFDLSKTKGIKDVIQQLPANWQDIDVLVNNAGTPENSACFQDSDDSGIDIMVDTNVKGLMHLTRQVLPNMLKRNCGYIINVGSIGSHLVLKGASVYCATKFAVLAFSRGLRHDLLGTNIRITTISPGFVDTEFYDVFCNKDQNKINALYEGIKPLLSEDIADSVLYCVNTPLRVNIDEIVIMPKNQSGLDLHRENTMAK